MKKVLIISTSIRMRSNSEILAHEFEKGAKEAGNDVTFVSLKDKNISFCRGCLGCQRIFRCVIEDDANAITDLMCQSDVIVWATPIYYYEMSGQMKTMIDRANSLYARNYKFSDVYLLATAAEEDENVPMRAISGLQGWIDCFDDVSLKGTLFVGGVNKGESILGNAKLKDAYELGKSII